MKLAICDDERSDLELIRKYCARYDQSLLVSLFSSGEELLEAFKTDFYDLVFLDIELGELSGIDVGTQLRAMPEKPVIIFTTHSLNYAVRGYGIAMRYLPKPISYETFSAVMREAALHITPKKISLCTDRTERLISIDDIIYFEVLRHQLITHLKGGESVDTRGTLADVIKRLPHGQFVQPHKSFYINMDFIDRLTRQEITMVGGDVVPIGRSKKDEFHSRLREYMRGGQKDEYLD